MASNSSGYEEDTSASKRGVEASPPLQGEENGQRVEGRQDIKHLFLTDGH